MDERILKWLFDIHNAITEIESYFIDHPKNFEHYKSNTLLKRAIERDIEIIGEAINRIVKRDENFPIKYSRKIVSLGNQIIHAYDNISDEIIWAIVLKHIPALKEGITRFIEESDV